MARTQPSNLTHFGSVPVQDPYEIFICPSCNRKFFILDKKGDCPFCKAPKGLNMNKLKNWLTRNL